MRIQLMSDLHLEIERGDELDYDKFDIPPLAPILALLGDIGVVADGRLFPFLRKQLEKFETVLYVLGNHESYRSTYAETITAFESFAASIIAERSSNPSLGLGEFIFLNRTSWSPASSPNVTILGCTLWSELNPDDLDILSWGMTDFKQISGMTAEAYDELHIADARWLEGELERLRSSSSAPRPESERKVVVLTHHAPIVEGGSDPKFSGPGNPTASGFVSDLTKPASGLDVRGQPRDRGSLLVKPVDVWAFGHTHWCCDLTHAAADEPEHEIRLVSNQRGYKSGTENRSRVFEKEFVIEV